jgi:hypothetical protein
MGSVLTKGSTIGCGHPPGQVSLMAAKSLLTVLGRAVLVKTDVAGATVEGCPLKDTSGSTQCKTAVVTAGEATKLTVREVKVMLADTLAGNSQGAPPPSKLTVLKVQTMLTAV